MRQIVAVWTIVSALLLWPASAGAATLGGGPLADLQLQLSAISMHAPGHVAMEVEDLATGTTAGLNVAASMPAASTIKIPVMVEVFRQLSLGLFDLNREVTLMRGDKDWGSGSLCDAPVGTRYSVSRLLLSMITVSDNTAANMLIRLVGRQHINHTMAELGLRRTRLSDYIRSDGYHIRYALRTSASDMVTLLTSMAKEELVDEWSSREMIDIMSRQRINSLLPRALPPFVSIAHKTGSLHDTLNDVGIVFADPNPYVIAVMTTNLWDLDAGRSFIRGVSRIAYDDMMRLASQNTNDLAPAPADATTTTTNSANSDGSAATNGAQVSGSDDVPMWGPSPAPAPTATP
ncbi:MAG: serine hydrolase [Candidatus Eremiobacteraeota bacterium]|nr:serine hydrolase [Candidatus Eremiobacteraeota bacterium]